MAALQSGLRNMGEARTEGEGEGEGRTEGEGEGRTEGEGEGEGREEERTESDGEDTDSSAGMVRRGYEAETDSHQISNTTTSDGDADITSTDLNTGLTPTDTSVDDTNTVSAYNSNKLNDDSERLPLAPPPLPPSSSPAPSSTAEWRRYLDHLPEMNLPWQPLRTVTQCSCGRAFSYLVSRVSVRSPHVVITMTICPPPPSTSITAVTVGVFRVMCVPVATPRCHGKPPTALTGSVVPVIN